jgi:flavin reductase (DIM6/NTAB) family NADH-FMN oxidoreductase RutF
LPDGFREISPADIDDNVFSLIADDWMLLTAGQGDSYNTMTASWGSLGELWHRKVAFVFVRPQRHTFGFMNDSVRFTASFFPEAYREALRFCGSRSGRDVDKAAVTGLTPVHPTPDTTAFGEARLILVCRKIYIHDLDPSGFSDPSVEECYPDSDYHRMYIGEIETVLEKT